jgi:hypothetical protein
MLTNQKFKDFFNKNIAISQVEFTFGHPESFPVKRST